MESHAQNQGYFDLKEVETATRKRQERRPPLRVSLMRKSEWDYLEIFIKNLCNNFM